MELVDKISSVLENKSRVVWSVSPDTLVYDAVEMMSSRRVGALLVLSGDKLAGIISERDYARKIILQGRSSKQTKVSEIMTSPVLFVTPDNTVDECMRLMTSQRVRHLPVMKSENVVGIISIGDLVKWIISAHEHTIQELNSYIAGSYPR